jgi:hypothetical protein
VITLSLGFIIRLYLSLHLILGYVYGANPVGIAAAILGGQNNRVNRNSGMIRSRNPLSGKDAQISRQKALNTFLSHIGGLLLAIATGKSLDEILILLNEKHNEGPWGLFGRIEHEMRNSRIFIRDETPLFFALLYDRLDLIRFFAESGLSMDDNQRGISNAIRDAARYDQQRFLSFMIEYLGANVNVDLEITETFLEACQFGCRLVTVSFGARDRHRTYSTFDQRFLCVDKGYTIRKRRCS